MANKKKLNSPRRLPEAGDGLFGDAGHLRAPLYSGCRRIWQKGERKCLWYHYAKCTARAKLEGIAAADTFFVCAIVLSALLFSAYICGAAGVIPRRSHTYRLHRQGQYN